MIAENDRLVPRHAATVLVLRPGDGGIEVLLARRHGRSGFAADAWVFPGGVVDDTDATLDPAHWSGIDPPSLAGRFRTAPDLVLGLHVAAVRETFEESGLLLATHRDGGPVDLDDPEVRTMRADIADRSTAAGAAEFRAWLVSRDLVLDLASLRYVSHWITPTIEARRYNTRFFYARAPRGQIAEHDRVEITAQRWIGPRQALEEAAAQRMMMMPPTIANLEELAAVEPASVEAALAHAAARADVPTILPHFERDEQGQWRMLLPGDPEFPYERYEEELA